MRTFSAARNHIRGRAEPGERRAYRRRLAQFGTGCPSSLPEREYIIGGRDDAGMQHGMRRVRRRIARWILRDD